ncbi:MAG: CoA-binding protein [Bacteroidales bacterium]|nr:CoA-binding protein [Bacteroidales bacterium]
MISKAKIDSFLENKKLAIAGVSRDPRKFSHIVYQDLKKRGYDVAPVNHMADNISGDQSYKSVRELPEEVKHLLILTPRKETDAVLRDAINKGITNIWVQQMSETADTIRIAKEFNVELIYKKCIYMFAEPVSGVHKFHRTLVRLFGRLPK